MNYYERHLGDYARDTGHLSLLEHGVYTLLMDRYYATEEGIPEAQAYRIARARSEDEKSAVDVVLAEFFTLQDGVWTSGRCERDIAKYMEKRTKAQASANARWADKPEPCERNANAMPTQCEGNAHQSPVTSNQTEKQKTIDHPSGGRFPDWWAAYPKKVGKPKALAIWKRRNLDAIADQLIADAIHRHANDDRWINGYVPNPETYLNQDRWEDEIVRPPSQASPMQAQSKTLTALEKLQRMKTDGQMDSRRDSGRLDAPALPKP